MRVEINVLGPFEFLVADTSIVVTASKPRQLLAMLALNAGHVVPSSVLIDEIWDQRPPRTATATLQTYVLHLRRRLTNALAGHDSAKNIIVTRDTGYLLNVDPDTVDAARYDQIAAVGHRAMYAGDHQEATASLGTALNLWHGPALAGVHIGPQLAIESIRLEENRLGDLDLRIDADLHLGRHRQLLGELRTLCARYPTQENFTAQSMLAFYRSGRQWQALSQYRAMRDSMVGQLGMDPSPRLRELHQAILSGDPAMDDLTFSPSSRLPSTLAA